jgi:mannose-6-phosphate isomerase-like protein (cupin superfamily)
LKKSACMVEAAPDEIVTAPEGSGISKVTFMVREGTGTVWVRGQRTTPFMALL